jgi:mediator of RNA polymerase II transcription subunit 17
VVVVLRTDRWAQFAACNALDLISLILSKDPTKTIPNSFSFMFQAQNVPHASFGISKTVEPHSEKQQDKDRIEQDRHRQKLVARGSRMQALDRATDSLLSAAKQFESEVSKEVNYWEEVLSISQKGWSIQRLRREGHSSMFAVRYGLPEASDHFKARGLAPLRMDKDGNIILDPALTLKPKTLRVCISDKGNVIGSSCLPLETSKADSLAIENSIRLARESLFEEELYHELSMETRQLLAYGVELRDSIVHIPIPGDGANVSQRKILIDCVMREDDVPVHENHSQDSLAQRVAEGLRLLLAHEHRMRLFRRSQPPPPLTQQKRQKQNPPFLRTLLSIFSHLDAVESLQAYLNSVVRILTSAGLDIASHVSRETAWESLTRKIQSSTRKDLSSIDQVFEAFIKPFDARATLSLPSSSSLDSEQVVVAVRTFFGQPNYGTEYKVTLPPSIVAALKIPADRRRDLKFPSAGEVSSYLDWVLSLDLSHNLLPREFPRSAAVKSKDTRITMVRKNGSKKISKDIIVELGNGKLTVTIGASPMFGGAASAQRFTWDGTTDAPSIAVKVKALIG